MLVFGEAMHHDPYAPVTFAVPAKQPVHVDIPKVMGRRLHLAVSTEPQAPALRIKDPASMAEWPQTEAYLRLLDFIQSLSHSVCSKKISAPSNESDGVKSIVNMLGKLDQWIKETPLETSSQRYGNTAFRTWFDRLLAEAATLVGGALPPSSQKWVPEISEYLTRSFGDRIRLDYGSGHELAFVAFLNCLDLIGFFSATDYEALVTRVFKTYIDLARKLQSTFNLEPAGSHGVWGY